MTRITPKSGADGAPRRRKSEAERRPRIMMVDDDGDILETIRASLGGRYEIVAFQSALSFWDSSGRGRPDLIVLDVDMPVIDGFSLCRGIRARPGFGEIPILFLTGFKEEPEFLMGLEAGGDSYMTKPFEMSELEERIEGLLDGGQRPPYASAAV